MSESIPIWEDWRFWQIVVTGALAFLGFTIGTWVKYYFDRRRDRGLRDDSARALATALYGEVTAIRSAAESTLQAIDQFIERDVRLTPETLLRMYIPETPIYDRLVEHVGLLRSDIVLTVVPVYSKIVSIREGAKMVKETKLAATFN